MITHDILNELELAIARPTSTCQFCCAVATLEIDKSMNEKFGSDWRETSSYQPETHAIAVRAKEIYSYYSELWLKLVPERRTLVNSSNNLHICEEHLLEIADFMHTL